MGKLLKSTKNRFALLLLGVVVPCFFYGHGQVKEMELPALIESDVEMNTIYAAPTNTEYFPSELPSVPEF